MQYFQSNLDIFPQVLDFLVNKSWTLETLEEMENIGSTQRTMETLYKFTVTWQLTAVIIIIIIIIIVIIIIVSVIIIIIIIIIIMK